MKVETNTPSLEGDLRDQFANAMIPGTLLKNNNHLESNIYEIKKKKGFIYKTPLKSLFSYSISNVDILI